MREYVEVKYGSIFNEFKQFYRDLDQANPGTKDITKSKQFKLWKKNGKTQQILQVQQNGSDSQNEQVHQNYNDDQSDSHSDDQSDSQNEQVHQNYNDDQSDSQNEQVHQNYNDDQSDSHSDDQSDSQNEQVQRNDILNQAINGPLSPDHMTIDQMDNLLQEIISDLQQDDDIRSLLNDEELFPLIQEDEGIDLDIGVEIDEPELLW